MLKMDDETRRIESWNSFIQMDDLRSLAEEALRRVAARADAAEATHKNPDQIALVEELCRQLLLDSPAQSEETVLELVRSGLPLRQVYHQYLGAAAVHLGDMWNEDKLSFVQVTRGVARIIVLMRDLRDHSNMTRVTHAAPILFTTVPGETHALGVTMARDLFETAGWDVNLLTGYDHDGLIDRIGSTDARAIGLSCGGAATASQLARLILGIRLERPELPILISGQIVVKHGNLVAAMAPDAAVTTIEEALSEMERLTGPAHASTPM